jgi:unsaturated chondroitin disaccharide hydrolase
MFDSLKIQSNFYVCIVFVLIMYSSSIHAQENETDTIRTKLKQSLDFSLNQYQYLLSNLTSYYQYPRSIKDNELHLVGASDWTSGFFPGVLWYLYEYSEDDFWKQKAQDFTDNLEGQKNNASTHDLGFMMYCSFGNGWRIAQPDYSSVLVQSAITLKNRFNESVGCIRSWDFGSWDFPVIIDNMMNLELLFWAARITGDTSFYNIAVKHAETTRINHFRNDFSSYHLVNYNRNTGEVINKQTFQGAADSSSWARGQAWGLYGYSMAYRETNIPEFLDQAIKIADYMIDYLPDDNVFYWDFSKHEQIDEPRDASAAAVTASALIELSSFVPDKQQLYFDIAEKILYSLSSSQYLSSYENNKGFILQHSTGHKPHNSEIDVPIIYADYYFIEALLRYFMIHVEPARNVIHAFSDQQIPNYAFNLIDGNSSDENRWSAENFPQWVIIDLGEEKTFSGVKVWTYQQRAYQYLIEASNDPDGDFQTIIDRTSNMSTAQPITDTIASVSARYIKISVTGANAYAGSWVSITELELIEDEVVNSTNEISIPDRDEGINGDILLFPNPVSNRLITVKANKPGQFIEEIKLIDMNGRIVFQKNVACSESVEFCLNGKLDAGIYIANFKTSEGFRNSKLIVY